MALNYAPPAPPIGGGRPRNGSNPSRYVPDGYPLPPPRMSSDGYLMAPGAGAPYPTTPGYLNNPYGANTAAQNQLVPAPNQAPYPTGGETQAYDPRLDPRNRPYSDARRYSQGSVNSHRSHRSHHSHHSDRHRPEHRHRSHSDVHDRHGYEHSHSHHYNDDSSYSHSGHHHHHHDYDDDDRYARRYSDNYDNRGEEYHHRHHHRHSTGGKYDYDSSYGKPLKRVDTSRPTLGDTVASMWSFVKDSLGSKD